MIGVPSRHRESGPAVLEHPGPDTRRSVLMCPEPNGAPEQCIRCRRPAPAVTPNQRDRYEAALSASGVCLGIVCPGCVNECIALDGGES
jgi:hypothetical protein